MDIDVRLKYDTESADTFSGSKSVRLRHSTESLNVFSGSKDTRLSYSTGYRIEKFVRLTYSNSQFNKDVRLSYDSKARISKDVSLSYSTFPKLFYNNWAARIEVV